MRSVAGSRDGELQDAGSSDHGADHGSKRNASAATSYQYDAANRLTAVTDPEGLVTRYSYDAVGQKVQQDSPDSGTTRYTFDAVGNRIGKTDARAKAIYYR